MNERQVSEDVEEDLPPETLYAGCKATCWDATPEEAQAARLVEAYVLAYAKHFSRFLDLSHLEEIIIGKDYPAAVATVNRNIDGEHAGPTTNEYGIGQATAIVVDRNGEPWSVVVLAAPIGILLANENDEGARFALFTLVHEFAHVDDHRLLRTLPGGWRFAQTEHDLTLALHGMTDPCRREYVAARRAAMIWPEQGEDFFNLAAGALGDLDEQVGSLVQAHGRDMPTFWPLVRTRVGFTFQALGYALGHFDGIDACEEVAPAIKAQFQERLEELRRLPQGWVVDEAHSAVRKYHGIKAYTGMDMHAEFMAVADKLLQHLGIVTREIGQDIRIDIFR